MRIVRFTVVRDEVDILPQNLAWYADLGFTTVLVDNGSSDGSFELARAALRDGRVAALDRLDTEEFEWDVLWRRSFELALEQSPDWLVATGADEFFEAADGVHLTRAIAADAAQGYNLLHFHNMEFWMTERDDPAEPDPLRRMRYYSSFDVLSYRAYPAYPGLDILAHGVHRPVFPVGIPDRPSPRRYVSRHYKLRSAAQGARKIRRVRPTRRAPRSNTHYLKYTGDPSEFVVPASRLTLYRDDHEWRFDQTYDGRRFTPDELAAHLGKPKTRLSE